MNCNRCLIGEKRQRNRTIFPKRGRKGTDKNWKEVQSRFTTRVGMGIFEGRLMIFRSYCKIFNRYTDYNVLEVF